MTALGRRRIKEGRVDMKRVSVIGAGAWGTSLAIVAIRAGHEAVVWAHEPDVAEAINRDHSNPAFLAGVALPNELTATCDLAAAAEADACLLAAPAQHLRSVVSRLAPHLRARMPILICSKGIETPSGALMSEVIAEIAPAAPVVVLSGPSFAHEVAKGLPTALTLASRDARLGEMLTQMLSSAHFRIYRTDDIVGAQIGGAVKNVIAIACGVVMGRGMGDNARAALITRGLHEMTRLARAKGGRSETVMGLSGLGDLTLTCTGEQSRNLTLGMALGRGERIGDILARRRSIAEGVATAASVMALCRHLGVEMPICAAVDAVANQGADIDSTIASLLARPVSVEGESPAGTG
jgi:glycerol-3-phosphate dehydrogenase (NAD(P)+)